MKFSYEATKTNGRVVQKELDSAEEMLKFVLVNADPSLVRMSFLNVKNGCGMIVRQYRGTFDICNYLEGCLKIAA